MTAIPPGMTASDIRVRSAAEAYAREFRIPIDEVREWYKNATDKLHLVDYMERMVKIEKDWRQQVADDYHAKQAGALR